MNPTEQKYMNRKPKTDPDIAALEQCVKALDKSTSTRMLKANLIFLWDRYVCNPSKSLPKKFRV